MNLVFHHLIPYAVLRDLWNLLIRECHDTEMAEARTALRQYMLLCARDFPDVDEWINRIREDRRLDVADCGRLATLAVWPPWNVVEGPAGNIRLDDYGDHYMERFTFGLTAREHIRMQRIELLYHAFIQFLSAGLHPAPIDCRNLITTIAALRPDLVNEQPIPFRAEMWEMDESTRRWKKRRSGDPIIPG